MDALPDMLRHGRRTRRSVIARTECDAAQAEVIDEISNCLDWDEHPFFDEIRGVEVSAHLLIERSGKLVQFVSFCDRAWHAGQSCFDGRDNCNDYSIGIELEGTDEEPYTDEQYLALSAVTGLLLEHYAQLGVDRIVGHSDISPGRKTDPGPAFDWPRYRNALA